jgi:hypothetical protein
MNTDFDQTILLLQNKHKYKHLKVVDPSKNHVEI